MARSWRRKGWIAFALLLGSAVAGCSPPPPGPIDASGPWSTYKVDANQVSLSVPRSWNVGEAWIQPSSFTNLTASYSNEQLSPPCSTGANWISCGPPLDSLQPGVILVEVWQNGSPQWTLDDQPGTATTVSGLPAKVDVQTGDAEYCSGMGADQTRREVIPFPSAPDNYVEVDICSRGVPADVAERVMASISVTPID